MKLPELIDRCYLERSILDDTQILKVILDNYTDLDIVKLIKIFVNGINKTHLVSGDLIFALIGIWNSQLEGFELTRKQKTYAIMGVLDNWSQMSLLAKIELDL